ncbi:MAG: cytochrome c family protein [Nitrospinota bacterium]|nr:cytochrome c family protein [Nitrospinota bacterium]
MKNRFVLIVFSIFLITLSDSGAEKSKVPSSWLDSYWYHPMAPQGESPKNWPEIEASLMPEDCGTCHEQKYLEWTTSRHSRAMRHGITGQLHEPWLSKEAQIACQACHSPLYEQQPYIVAGGRVVENRLYNRNLRLQGVACAACHIRKNVRYGPPVKRWVAPEAAHNGFVAVDDFNRSEFCKPCHQFEPEDRRVNGKLVQDTYEQWKASPAAKEGKSCASCHMADRTHTFQGIHSQRMVKNGVKIKILKEVDFAIISITNSGTGHKFPTYVTPKIAVTGRVINLNGVEMESTLIEYPIQWKVDLDMKTERFDTRLDPGETFEKKFNFPKIYSGNIYEIEVMVYPDEYYERFYSSLLDKKPEGVDLEKIKKALEDARNSSFSIYKRQFPF